MAQTLLLADDSVTIQRVIELTFADEDIAVVSVSDGDQAVARLESAPPDIVLADVAMPGRNGYEVAEYIKQTPHLSHIPVVLLTGAFEPVDKAKADAAGCDGVLAKPFEPQLVIGRVKELLARGAGQPMPVAETRHEGDAAAIPAPPPAAPAENPVDRLAPHQAGPGNLDDYFDRLDAAFANLDQTRSKSEGAPASPSRPSPLTYASPQADFAHAGTLVDETVASLPTPTEPPLSSSPPAPELPSLDEAFAALLAAEQGAADFTPPVAGGAALAITDQIVEEVTRRVLEHLSDRIVRETVADITERLVRQEIERIRASIK